MPDEACPHCTRRSNAQAVGLGVAAGIATAGALLLGRKGWQPSPARGRGTC